MSDCIVHWDDAKKITRVEGEIGGEITLLGESARTDRAGVRRVQLEPGMRSSAVHAHGAEEEIFFVLGGSGLLWEGGKTCEVGEGDCIVHLAGGKAHTLRAGDDGLDVLAFGTRVPVGLVYLPRAGKSFAGITAFESAPMSHPWKHDAAEGPLEFPEPGPRPGHVVALTDSPERAVEKGETRVRARTPGKVAGSKRSQLNHFVIEAGARSWPQHCHSAEEEIFVILDGEGVLVLGDDEHPVRRGHVVSRPAGTGVAHTFRAGEGELTFLAYSTREPNDITYYPKSGKIFLRGVGVIGRLEPLDYWHGEE